MMSMALIPRSHTHSRRYGVRRVEYSTTDYFEVLYDVVVKNFTSAISSPDEFFYFFSDIFHISLKGIKLWAIFLRRKFRYIFNHFYAVRAESFLHGDIRSGSPPATALLFSDIFNISLKSRSFGLYFFAESLGISSTTFTQCALKATEVIEITQKRQLGYAV